MITVQHLQKIYSRRGKKLGLLDADFTVQSGQIVGVLGANGAGKTTLLRTMAGLLPQTGGRVQFDGVPACDSYARLSYLTGEGSYFPCLSVGEYGAFLTDVHPAFSPQRYARFCEFFSLCAADPISRLSTGQRARVELAAGFAKKADYYLMDEPFLGKDVFTRRDFLKLMSATLRGGETVLLATHYIDEIDTFLDRALLLNEGRIVQDIDMEAMRAKGETLMDCMAVACGWDPERYLSFAQEEQA
ncbi:MAG: ABC transporter ATP-binding protein [Ruthenibacterium sp.]